MKADKHRELGFDTASLVNRLLDALYSGSRHRPRAKSRHGGRDRSETFGLAARGRQNQTHAPRMCPWRAGGFGGKWLRQSS